jgi:hypothetical protein
MSPPHGRLKIFAQVELLSVLSVFWRMVYMYILSRIKRFQTFLSKEAPQNVYKNLYKESRYGVVEADLLIWSVISMRLQLPRIWFDPGIQ